MPISKRQEVQHMAKPGRPRATEKKTTISINTGLSGWLEFRGRDYSRGVAEYLNTLAEEDRARVLAEDPDTAERYRAFCGAVGYGSEIEGL